MNYLETYSYLVLFLASFISGSFIPFSSEAIISTLLYKDFSLVGLIAVASLGNWIGGYTVFFMGYFGRWDIIKKYLKITPEAFEKFQKKFTFSIEILAFFCWIPFVGTLILIALGIAKSSVIKIGLYMFMGRLTRYLIWGILSIQFIKLI